MWMESTRIWLHSASRRPVPGFECLVRDVDLNGLVTRLLLDFGGPFRQRHEERYGIQWTHAQACEWKTDLGDGANRCDESGAIADIPIPFCRPLDEQDVGELPVSAQDYLQARGLEEPNRQTQGAHEGLSHRTETIDPNEQMLEAEPELHEEDARRGIADLVHRASHVRGFKAAGTDPFEIARHLAIDLGLKVAPRPADFGPGWFRGDVRLDSRHNRVAFTVLLESWGYLPLPHLGIGLRKFRQTGQHVE